MTIQTSNTMKQRNLTTLILCALFMSISALDSYAQLSNTLFFDKNNYRNHYLNPAERYNGQFFLNVPLYAPNAALEYGKPDREFCGLFNTYPRDMKAMFWLQDINIAENQDFALSSAFGTAWSLGYVTKHDAFLTMDISLRSEAWAEVPDKFNNAIFKGLNDGLNDLSGFSSESKLWAQASVTYARTFFKNMSIGISAKYLYGLSAVKTKFNGLYINNTADNATLAGDGEIYITSPGLDITRTESGRMVDLDDKSSTTFKNFTPKGRSGFAFDFGFTYNVQKNLKLSASVLDIGFINWKVKHGYRMSMTDTYNYVSPLTGKLTSLSDIQQTLTLLDDNTAKTSLVPKIYAGAEYALWKDRIGLGAIYKSRIFPHRTANEIIFSANLRMLKKLILAAAYTMPDYAENSVDVSLTAALDVLNIYIAVDNVTKIGDFNGDDVFFLLPSDNSVMRISAGIGFTFKKISKKKALQKIEYDNTGATITVTGSVQSRNKKGQTTPLAGVSITQAGSTNSTLTDEHGTYRISVPTGSALVFKYKGHNAHAESVKGRTEISVELEKVD